jgi:hypothetical protein
VDLHVRRGWQLPGPGAIRVRANVAAGCVLDGLREAQPAGPRDPMPTGADAGAAELVRQRAVHGREVHGDRPGVWDDRFRLHLRKHLRHEHLHRGQLPWRSRSSHGTSEPGRNGVPHLHVQGATITVLIEHAGRHDVDLLDRVRQEYLGPSLERLSWLLESDAGASTTDTGASCDSKATDTGSTNAEATDASPSYTTSSNATATDAKAANTIPTHPTAAYAGSSSYTATSHAETAYTSATNAYSSANSAAPSLPGTTLHVGRVPVHWTVVYLHGDREHLGAPCWR